MVNINERGSADNYDMIAMFEATNTYHNMDQIFCIFTEQLRTLEEMSKIRVRDEVKNCRVFLSGDYEFLTKVLGHMGPSASYPCLWCYVPLHHLSAGGTTHLLKFQQTTHLKIIQVGLRNEKRQTLHMTYLIIKGTHVKGGGGH